MASHKIPFGPLAIGFQLLFLVLFAGFASYDQRADGSVAANSDRGQNGTDPASNPINSFYPMFQDIHVMMFIGFGFLMTFLKRYGFSAVGFNMMITAFCIQWSMLMGGFLYFIHHSHGYRFPINIESMINADFGAATVLITFGALLGKTSPVQLLMIAFMEIIFFRINEFIGLEILKATDTGGSMYVHMFGAYFGLMVARVLYRKEVENSDNEGSAYQSDLFAMIGTIFLWMYWPSFNAALVTDDRQHRAVINTYLSLAACCITTFATHNMLNKEKKFEMVHVQNATLAGGVAVGTVADMMLHPAGAIVIGIISGALSSLGFEFILPRLARLKFHDTCGVNNLHGMPGLMSGILGIILAAAGSKSMYNYSLYEIYPGRAPSSGITLAEIQTHLPDVTAGYDRTAGQQAGIQALALLLTLLLSCLSGAITGLMVKWTFWDPPVDQFEDNLWWNTPEDFSAPNKKLPYQETDVMTQITPVYNGDEATQGGVVNPAYG